MTQPPDSSPALSIERGFPVVAALLAFIAGAGVSYAGFVVMRVIVDMALVMGPAGGLIWGIFATCVFSPVAWFFAAQGLGKRASDHRVRFLFGAAAYWFFAAAMAYDSLLLLLLLVAAAHLHAIAMLLGYRRGCANPAPPIPTISAADICHTCGYDLRGIGAAICPECGAESPYRRARAAESIRDAANDRFKWPGPPA